MKLAADTRHASENRLLDLWSIMEYCPSRLSARARKIFSRQYDRGASQPARRASFQPHEARHASSPEKCRLRRILPDRIEERIELRTHRRAAQILSRELQRSRQALSTLELPAGQSGSRAGRAHPAAPDLLPSFAGGRQKGLGSGKTSSLFELLERLRDAGTGPRFSQSSENASRFSRRNLEEKAPPYFMLHRPRPRNAGEIVQAFHDCKELGAVFFSFRS